MMSLCLLIKVRRILLSLEAIAVSNKLGDKAITTSREAALNFAIVQSRLCASHAMSERV